MGYPTDFPMGPMFPKSRRSPRNAHSCSLGSALDTWPVDTRAETSIPARPPRAAEGLGGARATPLPSWDPAVHAGNGGGLQLGQKRTGTILGHRDRAELPRGRSLVSSRCRSQEEGAVECGVGSFGPHCSVGGQLAHSLSVQSCPRKDATLRSGGPFNVTLPYFWFGMVPHRYVLGCGGLISFHNTGVTF